MKTDISYYVDDVMGSAGMPKKPDFPVIFVGPLGTEVPQDEIFEYTTISDLSEIGSVKERSVVLFREDQAEMLKVFSDHCELFGRTAQPLFGIPGTQYGVWFDDATFSRERASYGTFVSELRAAAEIAAQVAAASRSETDVESDRYRKADGRVRYNDGIGSGNPNDLGDDGDVDE